MAQRCDEHVDCADETDEEDCEWARSDTVVVRPKPPLLADFDGRGNILYKPLHLLNRNNGSPICPQTHFYCPGDGYCLPVYVRCNGVKDCPSGVDEEECGSFACPGFYRCRGFLGTCLHADHVCDGWPQCPQHDDERFCDLTCPENCTCQGLAFVCRLNFPVHLYPQIRYLDAGGTGLTPLRLIENTMLIHLSLANCGLAHLRNLTLPNLRSVDLSDNQLRVITAAALSGLSNLRSLSLARNPLSELFPGSSSDGSVVRRITYVDLSGVSVSELYVNRSLPFPGLRELNLTNSGVTRVLGDGFRSMTSLRVLDLRGCPLTAFPRDLLKGLGDLQRVYSDNYRLCCPATLPQGFNVDGCQAPWDEVSSCDALLRSDLYRVSLSVLAALALTGNLGCVLARVFALRGRGKTGFNVFVVHLCVSDFLMGMYLVMIGVADRLYLGTYLWEDSRWRESAACKAAGFLSLLSSEVSACIICLITLDRFLVIRFPFSRLRFSPFSAQVTCLVTWTGGILVAAVPLLPATSHWEFYGQTGICIPLPITRSDFAGHRYAFGVMILFNLAIFVVIAVGQVSVYVSMASNAMTSSDTSRKSKDLVVARRLITVVVSDFCCWFPIGLLGLLASRGVPISGEVNVAMAIFVLPLNSALNPFLYTLNIIKEKRQRMKEEKLLKLILDSRVEARAPIK